MCPGLVMALESLWAKCQIAQSKFWARSGPINFSTRPGFCSYPWKKYEFLYHRVYGVAHLVAESLFFAFVKTDTSYTHNS